MKTTHFLILAIAGLGILSGCKKEDDPSWEIAEKNIVVPHYSCYDYIHVQNSSLPLSVVVDAAAADWCTIIEINPHGGNDVEIKLDIAPNLIAEQRVAFVTVSKDGRSEVVTVTQEAGDATISVDDYTLIACEYTAGTYTIPVTSNASWTAAVAASATWCTLTASSGKGNGTITVSMPETIFKRHTTVFVNAGTARDSVTIFQDALPNNSSGVEINGITWAISNVDDFGTFAPWSPENPVQRLGKLYQFNRPVAYTVTDPLSPAWDNTYPESGNWSPMNDPCPGGWRVPSIAEYQSLNTSGWRWVTAAESEYGIPGTWFGPGAQDLSHPMIPTNAVFFPAVGARIPNDGLFATANDGLYFWEEENGYYWPNEDDQMEVWAPPMLFNSTHVITIKGWGVNKRIASSIRCIKK
jgi:uncharacterized protein (TIGR02145 family)